jgi:hypothetical protein
VDKIDVFPHILPRRYFERMLAVAPPGMALQNRMTASRPSSPRCP